MFFLMPFAFGSYWLESFHFPISNLQQLLLIWLTGVPGLLFTTWCCQSRWKGLWPGPGTRHQMTDHLSLTLLLTSKAHFRFLEKLNLVTLMDLHTIISMGKFQNLNPDKVNLVTDSDSGETAQFQIFSPSLRIVGEKLQEWWRKVCSKILAWIKVIFTRYADSKASTFSQSYC